MQAHAHSCTRIHTQTTCKGAKDGNAQEAEGPRCLPHGYALVQPFKCRLSFRPRWQFPGGDLWERWEGLAP